MQFFNFEPLISFLSFIFSFHQLWCTSFDQALRNFWLKAQLLKKWHMKLKRHHDIMYQKYKYTWNFCSIYCRGFFAVFLFENLNYPNSRNWSWVPHCNCLYKLYTNHDLWFITILHFLIFRYIGRSFFLTLFHQMFH